MDEETRETLTQWRNMTESYVRSNEELISQHRRNNHERFADVLDMLNQAAHETARDLQRALSENSVAELYEEISYAIEEDFEPATHAELEYGLGQLLLRNFSNNV